MTYNKAVENLPRYLKGFIIEQDYERYTPRDQAVWRYVMKNNYEYLSKVAHEAYIDGLQKTGISVERIPGIDEMNKILGEIGWGAVTVDGFIPPAAFMDFQAHNVLVIAADIRSADQIHYTPAPDIIHEAAGHAPIIANEDYAAYLELFGKIGRKAFSSKYDYLLYELIRHLSILKADPRSGKKDIERAEAKLQTATENLGVSSEMALLRNLHWWTVEYGLTGDLKHPKIYGAGLLSSMGESRSALQPEVEKLPYTLDAMDYSFDITKPQPQLFVTPDFEHLTVVLNQFADTMALRTGGLDGILKAQRSDNVATLVYSSGLQVSGKVSDVLVNDGHPVYVNTSGPTVLNYQNKALPGHDKKYHQAGFGSPIGKIKGTLKPTRLLSDSDLQALKIIKGYHCMFEFESGVKVQGVLQHVFRKHGKILLMSFVDCTVTHKGKTLFEPSWGVFDMAVGEKIVSVFSGPADYDAWGQVYEVPKEKTHIAQYSKLDKAVFKLYDKVKRLREGDNSILPEELWQEVQNRFPDEWLLIAELEALRQ